MYREPTRNLRLRANQGRSSFSAQGSKVFLSDYLGFCSEKCVWPHGRLNKSGFLYDVGLKPADPFTTLDCALIFGFEVTKRDMTGIMSHTTQVFGGIEALNLVILGKLLM